MAKRFGKRDGIFLGVLFAVLFFFCISFYFSEKKEGAVAEVTVDGELYGAYPLDQDQTVDIIIGETVANVLEIQNKTADITKASCPDKLCVHQKAISHANETIICLPNKVVVEIKGGREPALDAFT